MKGLSLLMIIHCLVNWADTAGKNTVQKTLIESVAQVKDTPADVLMSMMLDKVISFGFKLLGAFLVYIIGAFIIRWIRRGLRKHFEAKGTEKAVASFACSLVTALLWIVLIVVAIGLLGIETTSLAALLATGGMAIGMALSGTVQNFAGGVMLLVFHPFKVGDFIEAQGYSGTVVDMNITSTKITTTDNKIIVLPNGALSNGPIKNVNGRQYRRIDITVGVEYGSDADNVIALLLDIAKSEARVLDKEHGAPADPYAGIEQLAPNSVDFIFKVWVNTADYHDTLHDLNKVIYQTLPANGIDFPFPQLSVHMQS